MQCRSLGVETPAWCAAFWCSRYMQMSIVYFSKPLRYEERHDNNFVNKKYKQQWNAGEDHFGAAALRGAATAFQQTASVLASGEVACLYPTWLPSSRRCMMRRKWVAFHICASVSMRARWTCAHSILLHRFPPAEKDHVLLHPSVGHFRGRTKIDEAPEKGCRIDRCKSTEMQQRCSNSNNLAHESSGEPLL